MSSDAGLLLSGHIRHEQLRSSTGFNYGSSCVFCFSVFPNRLYPFHQVLLFYILPIACFDLVPSLPSDGRPNPTAKETMTMTTKHSSKVFQQWSEDWPYGYERRCHNPAKKNLMRLVRLALIARSVTGTLLTTVSSHVNRERQRETVTQSVAEAIPVWGYQVSALALIRLEPPTLKINTPIRTCISWRHLGPNTSHGNTSVTKVYRNTWRYKGRPKTRNRVAQVATR